MKIKKALHFCLALTMFLGLAFLFSTTSHAATGITNPVVDPALGTNVADAESGATFSNYFITIWQALIVVGGLALIFNLVNGAIEWITAGGEQAKVQHARQKMTNAIIGMIILAGSFVIIGYLSNLFGFSLLKFTIPSPS